MKEDAELENMKRERSERPAQEYEENESKRLTSKIHKRLDDTYNPLPAEVRAQAPRHREYR